MAAWETDLVNHESMESRLREIIEDPSYRLAFLDQDYITRDDIRPLRLQLELLKPETLLEEKGIKSTVVVFGGTHIRPREQAELLVAEARAAVRKNPEDPVAKRVLYLAEAALSKVRFYDECREFARLVSRFSRRHPGEFVVKTGGGSGIMEAANRGAHDVNAVSIGLNITLPFEQIPNVYITPGLCFQFNYFAIRKMHFLLRAKALICFPGGFGTLDEMFTTLTLRQTGRMQEIPIILYCREYWNKIINFQYLADEGVIMDEHLDLFQYVESPTEAWQVIADFHGLNPDDLEQENENPAL
jgi:uncharacterized protein (TIGR00730 family)